MRLDRLLFEKKFAKSRNKASELIKNGLVFVDGKRVLKPGFEVDEMSRIEVVNLKQYVSRAGEKLKRFLQDYKELQIEGKICLDVGSSTGGFVEVLLEEGAKKVVAVDVGSNQLHQTLREDKRVELYENCDIREFKPKEKYELVTCDVSFISVLEILEDLDRLATNQILILFKPQFEVGKLAKRDKRGVVKDEKAIKRAKDRFLSLCLQKWDKITSFDSKIKGKEGNIETFYLFEKRGD